MLIIKCNVDRILKKHVALWQAIIAVLICILITVAFVLFLPAKIFGQAGLNTVSKTMETDGAVPPENDGIQIMLEEDKAHRTFFTDGGGSGSNMNWADQFDFNIRCTGRPDIKRVTYTAHNCEFMKKLFFTKQMMDNKEYTYYGVNQVESEQQKSGDWVSWGFTPVGYVYSADFLEEVNLTNFGLKITYTQKDYQKETSASSFARQMKETNRLREQAYANVSITAEIELEDGSVITKTIRIRNQTKNEQKAVTVYLE